MSDDDCNGTLGLSLLDYSPDHFQMMQLTRVSKEQSQLVKLVYWMALQSGWYMPLGGWGERSGEGGVRVCMQKNLCGLPEQDLDSYTGL